MSYYRARRMGCGGALARGMIIMMVGVVGIICFAARGWFESRAFDAIYGNRPRIHLGRDFTPGASAVEDGVRQTAVMINGHPSVRVTKPTAEWRRHHRDAVCAHKVCTAAATPKKFARGVGAGISTVLVLLLGVFIVWTVLFDDDRMPFERMFFNGRR